MAQIRTSLTHPLLIADLKARSGGTVGVTFCPGKCGPSLFGHTWQRDLAADLDAIRAWGAQCMLTLVEHHELENLQVAKMGDAVAARGIRWLHLPIVDVSIPSQEFEAEWRKVVPQLVALLSERGKILVHCKGGLGRAGTVAALLLIETGESPTNAVRLVRTARPGAIETSTQERYVLRYQPHSAGFT